MAGRLAGLMDKPLDTPDPTTTSPPPDDPPIPPVRLPDGRLQCGHANCRGWINNNKKRTPDRCPNCNRLILKDELKDKRRK